MFSINYPWKEFEVHLPSFEAWLRSNAGAYYKGNSADVSFTMWFEEEPSEEIKTAITNEWASFTENGETVKIQLEADRNAAVVDARTAALTASFDDLIAAERKLWMGATLTTEDLDALLVKYPQS